MNRNATEFPELNAVLVEIAERASAILGDDFVGAYVQGSFAVGDADMASDCDFLIPVRRVIPVEQEEGLRALHRELPARDGYWCKRIEGSYPVTAELRTISAMGKPWLYIDNGWSEMSYSTHCNTEVVRWSLRECGITITGPDPKTLVDEVSAEVLRARMREDVETLLPSIQTWQTFDIAWTQRYAVTTLCRIMHTVATGRITSKKAALEWARGALGAEWRGLIERAIAGRLSKWDAPADAEDVRLTYAFAEWAKARLAAVATDGMRDP